MESIGASAQSAASILAQFSTITGIIRCLIALHYKKLVLYLSSFLFTDFLATHSLCAAIIGPVLAIRAEFIKLDTAERSLWARVFS